MEDRRLLSEPPLPPGSGHPHNHLPRAPPGQVAIAPHLKDLRNPCLGFYHLLEMVPDTL